MRATQLAPGDLISEYYLAFALERRGNISEAVTHLESVARREPTFADTCYRLGYLHQQQGNFEEALHWYAVELEDDPSCLDCRLAMVECHLQKADSGVAVSILDSILIQDIDEAASLQKLGDLYMECEMYEKAIPAYEKATSLGEQVERER